MNLCLNAMTKTIIATFLFELILLATIPGKLRSQCLILGADLSYVNTISEKGGQYRDPSGALVEPYAYFSNRGADMIRIRVWHTPENITDFCGHPITSCNLNDVLIAAKKVKEQGMGLMLAVHYGDYFNDPGKQQMPQAWQGSSQAILLDSIYNYTYAILERHRLQNTVPDIIGIGNETTFGFVDASATTNGWSWPQDAAKFNRAMQAVNDFNQNNGTTIKKAVHFTESTAVWLSGLFPQNGIDDYDIIGISYYPSWSSEIDLSELGTMIQSIVSNSGKEVMIFETGFVWFENGWADNYGNILNKNGNVLPYESSPEGQLEYLTALSQTVYENGGSGVFYWEPAYISSNMCTKWGKGSPWENVTFFDFTQANRALPAFDFFGFCDTQSNGHTALADLHLYPNPAIGSSRVRLISTDPPISWEMLTMQGQRLIKSCGEQGQEITTIDVPKLSPGLYLVKFNFQNGLTRALPLSIY